MHLAIVCMFVLYVIYKIMNKREISDMVGNVLSAMGEDD